MAEAEKTPVSREGLKWLRRWTRLDQIERAVLDREPRSEFEAWARTTAGVVSMLLALQFVTGLLLAFYYVPSAESAHATVAYIEKVLPSGSWLRALHHYGSQWLTLFLVLHLAQLFWRESYRRRPVGWVASALLLLLVLASGATGYSLPWDARAFFGTRVAEGLAGGLPLVGSAARRWLLGGAEISALTLARFSAAHLLLLPALTMLSMVARLFIFREGGPDADAPGRQAAKGDGAPRGDWVGAQAARQGSAAGLVFLALALFALKFYAPLGPAAEAAGADYLPRPGPQFLWLFQMLKYLPGRFGSVIAVALPGLFFLALLVLPFLDALPGIMVLRRRRAGAALLMLGLLFFTLMTALAYVEDRLDPRVRAQLARQEDEERAFRARPFEPLRLRAEEGGDEKAGDDAGPVKAYDGAGGTQSINGPAVSSSTPAGGGTGAGGPVSPGSPPDAYLKNCANCHGTRGQGFSIFPKLTGVSAKPHRTVEDLIAILDDPASYGLKPPMKSFANQLTDDEKRQVAEWVATLRKGK